MPKILWGKWCNAGDNERLNIAAHQLLTSKKTSHSSRVGLNRTWECSHFSWVNTNLLMPYSFTAHPTPASPGLLFFFFSQLNLFWEEAGILYSSTYNNPCCCDSFLLCPLWWIHRRATSLEASLQTLSLSTPWIFLSPLFFHYKPKCFTGRHILSLMEISPLPPSCVRVHVMKTMGW